MHLPMLKFVVNRSSEYLTFKAYLDYYDTETEKPAYGIYPNKHYQLVNSGFNLRAQVDNKNCVDFYARRLNFDSNMEYFDLERTMKKAKPIVSKVERLVDKFGDGSCLTWIAYYADSLGVKDFMIDGKHRNWSHTKWRLQDLLASFQNANKEQLKEA
jgi:hypothetical protein